MTLDELTELLTELDLGRWYALALPEDVTQEWELSLLLGRTPQQVADIFRYRLRLLRHEVWDIVPTRVPRAPSSLRPSKMQRATGYRTDSARKSSVRNQMDEERRAQIARMGGRAKARNMNARS